jgi:glycosyltransferase involved in cell wall biosynthesis
VIEALAAGIPVVSTDVGGVSDVVNDPILGAIAPDNDVTALATHVVRLLSPAERTPERIAARRASVMARYGFDRLMSDIVSVYHALLS